MYPDAFDTQCFQYRDYKGNEIDSIVQFRDGRWFAFEIKLGENAIDDAAYRQPATKRQRSPTPPSLARI
ncbi:MAG: hypothetical protein HUJ60_05580 [Bacilli bacterium]|nr:hypothetical protein [Bacilli bacterium]